MHQKTKSLITEGGSVIKLWDRGAARQKKTYSPHPNLSYRTESLIAEGGSVIKLWGGPGGPRPGTKPYSPHPNLNYCTKRLITEGGSVIKHFHVENAWQLRPLGAQTNGRQVRHYAPHPTPPKHPRKQSSKRSKYERRNARSVPAPGKSRQAITVTITACRVKSKNVANVSYLPRFLASPNLSRRGPDPAGSGNHCKIVPVNEPACRV